MCEKISQRMRLNTHQNKRNKMPLKWPEVAPAGAQMIGVFQHNLLRQIIRPVHEPGVHLHRCNHSNHKQSISEKKVRS